MPKTTRIDKYLAQLGLISRREAKKVFRAGRILLNGYIEKDHGTSVIDGDEITIDDLIIIVRDTVTILLHKPAGYVCSEIDDGGHASYKHLLDDCIYAPMIHVAGRLDYDTS
jgi:16S rRNA pseudouridine516 synthase